MSLRNLTILRGLEHEFGGEAPPCLIHIFRLTVFLQTVNKLQFSRRMLYGEFAKFTCWIHSCGRINKCQIYFMDFKKNWRKQSNSFFYLLSVFSFDFWNNFILLAPELDDKKLIMFNLLTNTKRKSLNDWLFPIIFDAKLHHQNAETSENGLLLLCPSQTQMHTFVKTV